MELTVGVNSYISLEEAEQLVNDYITVKNILNWVKDEIKQDKNYLPKIINISTKLIDKLDYKGVKVDKKQPLSFPRVIQDGKDKVIIECPEDIKIGIVLQAITNDYFENTDEEQAKRQGISNYSVDGASITFNNSISIKGSERIGDGIYKSIYKNYIREYTEYI